MLNDLESGEEREKEGKREEEKHQCERNIDQLPLVGTPTGRQICNLGTCSDQESNLQPFGLWDDAPTN